MTCRSYFFSLRCRRFLFPLFYCYRKKTLSLFFFFLIHRSFFFLFAFFFFYASIIYMAIYIYCAENVRCCVQSIIHLRHKKNGMKNARKLKKSGIQNAFSACLQWLCNMLSDHYCMKFLVFSLFLSLSLHNCLNRNNSDERIVRSSAMSTCVHINSQNSFSTKKKNNNWNSILPRRLSEI